ncbi:MAG TPA: FUSC family protein, partial [Beijerinckiaceae bacterium]
MRNIARKVVERWSAAWRDALASAAAAGLSWGLAHQLLGHPQPVFAAVAAVVCLAPGLPGTRGRQAVNMLLGLVTGIVVGEVLLTLPVFNTALRVASITFVAMMAALSFGLAPTMSRHPGCPAASIWWRAPVRPSRTAAPLSSSRRATLCKGSRFPQTGRRASHISTRSRTHS